MCDGSVTFVADAIDSGDPNATPPGKNTVSASVYGVWGKMSTYRCNEVITARP